MLDQSYFKNLFDESVPVEARTEYAFRFHRVAGRRPSFLDDSEKDIFKQKIVPAILSSPFEFFSLNIFSLRYISLFSSHFSEINFCIAFNDVLDEISTLYVNKSAIKCIKVSCIFHSNSHTIRHSTLFLERSSRVIQTSRLLGMSLSYWKTYTIPPLFKLESTLLELPHKPHLIYGTLL